MDAFKRDAPAPGTYSLVQMKQKKEKVSAPSFKSKSKRCNYIDELVRSSPAPGAYNPGIPADLRKSNIRYAAFRSKSARLPEWKSAVPGPGEYDPVKPAMRKKRGGKGMGASSSFANTNVDRFGTPYDRKVAVEAPGPGPGSYTPAFEKQQPTKTSSAWAKSAVLRGVQRPKFQPPGPSYYSSAGKLSKRSYHLNVNRAFT